MLDALRRSGSGRTRTAAATTRVQGAAARSRCAGGSLPWQRRHGVPAAHRRPCPVRRALPPLRRAAHARAADRRSGRWAARARRGHRLPWPATVTRRSRSGRPVARSATPRRVRGDVSSQFLTALLMALPLTGAARRGGGGGRAHLEAVRRDHAQPHAAFRRRARARRLGAVRRSGRRRAIAARAASTSRAMRRPRPTSSPRARSAAGRCAWRASTSEHPGRRALRRGAARDGRRGRVRRGLDRGARPARRCVRSTST